MPINFSFEPDIYKQKSNIVNYDFKVDVCAMLSQFTNRAETHIIKFTINSQKGIDPSSKYQSIIQNKP